MASTFFFRDQTPLELAINNLCPRMSERSRIRIWDAGCATGQESYTLAILMAEGMGPFRFRNVKIIATDHDVRLLDVVAKAFYPVKELERTPIGIFEKYFEPAGASNLYKPIDPIRKSVHLEHHDLLSFTPLGYGFSLVVCRNVLLHFKYCEQVQVIRMFYEALEPDGLLVMEHTQKMPEENSFLFSQISLDGQVYRKEGVQDLGHNTVEVNNKNSKVSCKGGIQDV
jgi:chemotaxis protein methyltransferase CheR